MNKKREIFVRLSNNRLNPAIKAIKLVGNLGNKSHYEKFFLNYKGGT